MSQTAIIQETTVHAIYNGLCLTNEGQPCVIQNVDFGKLANLVDAALHAKAGVSVKVKELVWVAGDGETADNLYFEAKSIAGTYWVIAGEWGHRETETHGMFDTDGEAFAAAEAHYDARILSALSTKLQEPVAWRWKAKGSSNWIYDPTPGWLEAQGDSIVKEPLYTLALAHQPVTAGLEKALEALEPFVQVLEHDISVDETDSEIFQPMRENHRAPLLTIADFRRAASALAALKSEGR